MILIKTDQGSPNKSAETNVMKSNGIANGQFIETSKPFWAIRPHINWAKTLMKLIQPQPKQNRKRMTLQKTKEQ